MPERADPPDVAFVPGFMQRGEAWRPVADRLGTRYRSHLLDLEGTRFADLVDEIADRAPPPPALVGYSMGGRLVLHAALQVAQRGAGSFAAICTVGASAGIEEDAERRERAAQDEELAAWIERRPIADVVARWERRPVFATQPPELVAGQREARLAHDPRRLAALLRGAGQGATPPAWDRLDALDPPLLAIAGAEDAPYAEAARRMAALAPRGRAAVVPGAGHAAHLERPDAVARVLGQFLDEHLGQGGVVHLDAEARPGRHGQ